MSNVHLNSIVLFQFFFFFVYQFWEIGGHPTQHTEQQTLTFVVACISAAKHTAQTGHRSNNVSFMGYNVQSFLITRHTLQLYFTVPSKEICFLKHINIMSCDGLLFASFSAEPQWCFTDFVFFCLFNDNIKHESHIRFLF